MACPWPVPEVCSVSGIARTGEDRAAATREHFRLSSQVAGLIAVVTLLVVVPALWLVDSLVRERLVQHAVNDLRGVDAEWLGDLQNSLLGAESSARHFARLLDTHLHETRPEDEEEFHALVERDTDGLWRSRRAVFDGRRQAGIWAPDGAVDTAEKRSFFVQARQVTEIYGEGARRRQFVDTWILPAENGEIIFWPGQPEFVYQAEAGQDYRPTEWFQLTTPEANPGGEVRWTATAYDPVARSWMISVVAPFSRQGRWAGSVGHDLIISDLVERMLPMLNYPRSQMVMLDDHGRVLASTHHQDIVEASVGQARLADLRDGPLAAAFQAGQARLRQSSASSILMESRRNLIFAGLLEGPDWTVLHVIPRSEVVAMVETPFRFLRWGALGCFLLVIAASAGLVARDSMRRVKAERAARVSADTTRALLDATTDVALLLDTAGRVQAANGACARALGTSAQELVGRSVFDFLPPDVAERRRAWLAETVSTGQAIHRDDADGPLRYDNLIYPIRDDDGLVKHVAVFARDITERRAAEQALARSEQRYRTIVETAQEGIWLMDRDNRVTFVNDRMARLLGYEVADMTGRPLSDFLDDESRAHVQQQSERLRSQTSAQFEVRFRRRDAGALWTLVSASSRFDETGSYVGALGMCTDITDRRRAEQERQRLEQRIMQAQKLESLGVLAGGIAHDFNNLLQAILGHAELALDAAAGDTTITESLQEIRAAGQRAATISGQMLAYSGRGGLAREIVSVSDVISNMSHMLRLSVSRKTHLHQHLMPDLPPVRVDVSLLRQAVLNLVINASEALEDREGDITVNTGCLQWSRGDLQELVGAPELPEGAYVHVEVKDTGSGMDHAIMEHMFDPFFSTKFPGRGLGLPVVQGFARAHQGGIRVHSRHGEGTTIAVVLPVHEAGMTPPLPSQGQDGWRGEGTLLVVDDEQTVLSLGRRLLGTLGFRVVTAGDGREAMEALRGAATPFRAVLLDLVMPRMSGDEALDAIRKEFPGLPVLVVSGYARAEVEQRLQGHRPDGFVQKPFDRATLVEALRAILG